MYIASDDNFPLTSSLHLEASPFLGVFPTSWSPPHHLAPMSNDMHDTWYTVQTTSGTLDMT